MVAIFELERGRASYDRQSWQEAFDALAGADRLAPLAAEDLELLARSAYLTGRDDEYVRSLERAYRAYLEAGDAHRAVRCAFWIGNNMLFRGQAARARGWFARARRLLNRQELDCVERGYLLLPVCLERMTNGQWEAAHATAAEAAELGERFAEPDLIWLARAEQARALLKQGRAAEGLALVDEALVVVGSGELSPIVTGIVYCNTIAFCRDGYELRHAREWTEALTSWCARQPEMVAHNGVCLVHRAEITQMRGAWEDALEQAQAAAERFTQGMLNQRAVGQALYRQGEIYRLRGDLVAAAEAYRAASRRGCEPQPGLSLLRLAQGEQERAAAAIERAVLETTEPLKRGALLPAQVEIMLGVERVEAARSASRQLAQIAQQQGCETLHVMAAYAGGAVALAEGNAGAALIPLRRAAEAWQELGAPYEAARARVLVGVACQSLGDEDSAKLEFEAAGEVFAALGAPLDLARVESFALGVTAAPVDLHGLTSRELEVLRLVAAGKSNREIADALVLSEHTVRRHLQNIFAKLRVSSRTAATAFAFEQDVV